MLYTFHQYNNNDFRIVLQANDHPGLKSKNVFKDNDDDFITSEKSLRSAISRSKRMVREYALCNDFEYFVTLTVNSLNCDRFSLTECENNIKRRLKTYKQYNKDFIYILIPEEHDKGGFHFHGLFGGCNPKDIILYRKEDFDKLPVYILRQIEHGKDVFYSKVFLNKTGWCTLTKIKDKSRCGSYITKYIIKNPLRNENGTLYISSRGLKKAYSYPILPFDFYKLCDTLGYCRTTPENYHDKNVKKYLDNDYVKVLDYRLDDLTKDQKMYIQKVIKEVPSFVDILKNKLERHKEF